MTELQVYVARCLIDAHSADHREDDDTRFYDGGIAGYYERLVALFYRYKAEYDNYLTRNPHVKSIGRYPDYAYASRQSGLFDDVVRMYERKYHHEQEVSL